MTWAFARDRHPWLEFIFPPSGKNCPVRGGFRLLGSARRPVPVCNCYLQRELRFFLRNQRLDSH